MSVTLREYKFLTTGLGNANLDPKVINELGNR